MRDESSIRESQSEHMWGCDGRSYLSPQGSPLLIGMASHFRDETEVPTSCEMNLYNTQGRETVKCCVWTSNDVCADCAKDTSERPFNGSSRIHRILPINFLSRFYSSK